MVENCLKVEDGAEGVANLLLDATARGARSVCDWRAGSLIFLVAVRMRELRADMIVN
jgi:hypothetical protein